MGASDNNGDRQAFEAPGWIEPREYQVAAVDSWVDAAGKGILNMATGTGKTITSLLAASRLAELQDGRIALVIAVPYQHLVDQWASDVEEFGVTPIRAYGSRTTWVDRAVSAVTEFELGARDVLCIITTQATFSMDHFQQLVERFPGGRTLLIADEVHHMGAPHLSSNLPTSIRARLGLSATPERWYDDEGTETLFDYFGGGVVFEYGLREAISNGFLCEYYYIPHIVELTDEESEEYLAISRAIGKRLAGAKDGAGQVIQHDETLQRLLIKRSRLVGSAEEKLELLADLLRQQIGIQHTLVYCGDGRVPADNEQGEILTTSDSRLVERQIQAATKRLGTELGLRVHQFTYEESQPERERLLSDFDSGEIQILVAIRCLDEGVDIPATQTAYMLASSSNPRQYVQRRGRILRTHPDKRNAVIHDLLVRPPAEIFYGGRETSIFNVERTLIEKELMRASKFAEMAMNHPETAPPGIPTSGASLIKLKKDFNLLDT